MSEQNQQRGPEIFKISGADRMRITAAVENMLTMHMIRMNQPDSENINPDVLVFDVYELRKALGLKNTNETRMVKIIEDALTYTDIVNRYGSWIIAEWEGGEYVMLRMPKNDSKVVRVSATKLMAISSTFHDENAIAEIRTDIVDAMEVSVLKEEK